MHTTRPRRRNPISALRAPARTTTAMVTAGEQRRWAAMTLAAVLLVTAAAFAQVLGPVPAWVNIALWVAAFGVGVGVITVLKAALR